MKRWLHGWIAVALSAAASLATASTSEIEPASPERDVPAERAGIAPGDVIVRFGNKQVRHPMNVTGVLLGAELAQHVAIEFICNGKSSSVEAQLALLPIQPAP
jgi:S1-C subfamily serine protease